jgi:hypothetical protein
MTKTLSIHVGDIWRRDVSVTITGYSSRHDQFTLSNGGKINKDALLRYYSHEAKGQGKLPWQGTHTFLIDGSEAMTPTPETARRLRGEGKR